MKNQLTCKVVMLHQHLYLTFKRSKINRDCLYPTEYLMNNEMNTIFKSGNNCDGLLTWNKIEASTDSSLGLLQIPQSFIEAYVKADGKIEEVNIEMEKYKSSNSGNTADIIENGHHGDLYRIKTREDNTVIIYQSKTYTIEEVINLIAKAFKAGYERSYSGYPNTDNHTKPNIDKWIEENL